MGVGMVRRFAAEDARVVIGARQREQVADLLDELGAERGVFARLDVTSEQHWTGAVATAEAAFGPVSVLVNNAARAIVGTTMSLTPDVFREAIDTNLVGTFLGTRAAVPSMCRRGGGSIVNINSTAGIGATGELIVGIDDQLIPRLADVDETSSLVLFVASDDAVYSTGAEFVADGGYLLGPVPARRRGITWHARCLQPRSMTALPLTPRRAHHAPPGLGASGRRSRKHAPGVRPVRVSVPW
ncbi:SDR family oxidoreductase [Streptomyces mirabilis]|uniref:SDR family oxidoreductase n=1 Tax=Streptomyces mirabilis TaxID=68239 RepID=UPI0036C5BEA8